MVKEPPASGGDARDLGLIPGSGRSPGGGHGNPLQYSCPENPMDRGAWRATVHGVTKSRTQLKQLSTHGHLKSTLPYMSLPLCVCVHGSECACVCVYYVSVYRLGVNGLQQKRAPGVGPTG